jgi:hypothetical protein
MKSTLPFLRLVPWVHSDLEPFEGCGLNSPPAKAYQDSKSRRHERFLAGQQDGPTCRRRRTLPDERMVEYKNGRQSLSPTA